MSEYKLHGAIQTFHRERPYEWKPGANTIAYYPLTSDTTVNDMSGNGNNLTNSNVLFGEYDGVNCAYLNGNAYLTVPDIVNNTSEWTMSFYIKPSTTTGTMFSKQWDGNNTSLIGMGFYTNSGGTKTNGTNYYVYGKTYNAGGSAVSNNEALSTSSWSNVILVGSSSSMEIYVNGVLKNTGSGNYSFPDWNSYTAERIGSRLGNGSEKGKLTGYMGSFIFENKKWTAQDVIKYYNRSKDNYESTPHIPVYDNLLETKDASNWITSSVNYDRYLWDQFDYVSPITTSYKIVIERVGGSLVAVSPTSQSDSSQYSTSDEGIVSVDSGGHLPLYTYFPPRSTGGYIAYLYGDSAA